MTTVVLGWLRAPDGSCGGFRDRDLTAQNSLFVRCRPKFVQGRATVRTDASGRIQNMVKGLNTSETDNNGLSKMFTNDPVNLMGQSNQYLFTFSGGGWHNDSHAEDFMNYFATRETNSSRLVDPTTAVPTLEDVEGSIGKAYSRLFAIWLGANKEKLLVSAVTRRKPRPEVGQSRQNDASSSPHRCSPSPKEFSAFMQLWPSSSTCAVLDGISHGCPHPWPRSSAYSLQVRLSKI